MTATEQAILDQLGATYLGEKVAKPGPSVSAFVFFPEDEYSSVRVIAVELLSEAERDAFGPMVKPTTD